MSPLAVALLAAALAARAAIAAPPPIELRELDAVVLDSLRLPSDRRAALERSIEIRRRLLPNASGAAREALALDLAESLALVRPALDGTDLFATVGLLTKDESERLLASVEQALTILETVKPSPRSRVLRAVAAARALDLRARGDPAAAEEEPAPIEGLSSPTREIVLLANARLRMAIQPAHARQWLRQVADATDAPSGVRLAARLLAPLAAAEGGSASGLEQLEAIARESGRSGVAERLLVADALARAARALDVEPKAAIEAWTALLASATREDAAALRAAVLWRVRAIVAPAEIDVAGTAPLLLAAFAADLAARDPSAVESALQAALEATRNAPRPGALEPLLRYEHARALALLGRYQEGANEFRTLALERSGDPVAADAIDLAIEILAELAQVSLSDEVARKRATDAITDGLAQHFDHPNRDRWRVLLGNLELDRGRLAAARMAFESVPGSPDARLGEALAWLLTASSAREAGDRAEAVAAADRSIAAAADARNGRRDLVEGLRARVNLDPRVALHRFDAALADASLSAGDTRRALTGLFETHVDLHQRPELTPSALMAVRRLPTVARDVIVSQLEPTFSRSLEVSAATLEAEAQRVSRLLPPPAEVLGTMTPADRALVANALLADGRPDEALGLTAVLVAQDPLNTELLLLHARASEKTSPAAATAIYRALIGREPSQSRGWWSAQVGELRLLLEGASRERAEVVLTRVNRLRLLDRQLGGERTRAALEGIAARALELASLVREP